LIFRRKSIFLRPIEALKWYSWVRKSNLRERHLELLFNEWWEAFKNLSNDDTKKAERQTIFTIGHSNLDLEVFVKLLKDNDVEVLVDVRSNPSSRFASQFNKRSIQKAIKANNMKYLFLGKELGGKPEGPDFYDSDGYVLYSRIADSPLFVEGIERLMKGIKQYRVAIMCSEENPINCHRMLLVGRVLSDKGIQVLHIRGDGRIQSEDDVIQENNKSKNNEAQQNLFKSEEKQDWKSTLVSKHDVLLTIME
jgi:hypothetical protein